MQLCGDQEVSAVESATESSQVEVDRATSVCDDIIRIAVEAYDKHIPDDKRTLKELETM
jgi:hypothetical protein